MENKVTTPAHTPGPWTVRNKKLYDGSDAEGFSIRSKSRFVTGWSKIDDAEDEANARLISAAPDLRIASQQLYDRLQDYLDVSDAELIEKGHRGLVEAMDKLEAAWHRADGTKHDHE